MDSESSSLPSSSPVPAAIPQHYRLDDVRDYTKDCERKQIRGTTADDSARARVTPHAEESQHFSKLIDAATRGPITSATRLGSIYQFEDVHVDNEFLRDISGKSTPVVPVQLIIVPAGEPPAAYPPALRGFPEYDVYLCLNTLSSAPCVRIEFHFRDMKQPSAPCFQRLALEYPFNERDGRKLSQFAFDIEHDTHEPSVMCFEANGATSEGLTLVSKFAQLYTDEQQAAVEMMKRQVVTGSITKIVLSLDIEALGDERHRFEKVLNRLPDGDGILLSSIDKVEWSNFPSNGFGIRNVKALMHQSHGSPNLMLAQDCGLVFASLAHFRTVMQISELIANHEGYTEIICWAMAQHKGKISELNGHSVLSMKYGPPIMLANGIRLQRHPKLPEDLEIKFRLVIDGIKTMEITACHERDLMGLDRHVKHDAHFKITSPTLQDLSMYTHSADDTSPTYWPLLGIIPHENSFWANSVLKTCQALHRQDRWHPLMLGQSFDALKRIDVIAAIQGVTDLDKVEAKQWLLKYKNWNTQQRQVIESMHDALGGVVLCDGIAGTGKSSLISAIAVYFVKNKGRSLIGASERAQVENISAALCPVLEDIKRTEGKTIKAYLVHRLSRKTGVRGMTTAQAAFKKVGHTDECAGGLDDYKFVTLAEDEEPSGAWKLSLSRAVAEEADNGHLHWHCRLRTANGCEYGNVLDVWDHFRKFRRQDVNGSFPWNNKQARIQYHHAYSACEGYLIANADIIITTTCNAHCKELVRYWNQEVKQYNVNVKAIAVFGAEADNSRQMESFGLIASSALSKSPDLVMFAGDIQTLGPVNTSLSQKPLCNPFATSLSKSQLSRLVSLGFPCIRLTEQYAMNSELVRYPSLEFYDNELTTAHGTDRPLEEIEPGLPRVLLRILSRSRYHRSSTAALGERLRQCYLRLWPGTMDMNDRKSVVVLDHVEVFFAHVLPGLQEHFQDRMREEVIVIVAYAHARTKYMECMHGMQEKQGHEDTWYPRVMSVDGSKGRTAKMAFFDGSMQHRDRMGFLNDRGRCNVAMTRATEVFWIIGGPLGLKGTGDDMNEDPPFYKLKELLVETGQVVDFDTPQLETIRRLTAKSKG